MEYFMHFLLYKKIQKSEEFMKWSCDLHMNLQILAFLQKQ